MEEDIETAVAERARLVDEVKTLLIEGLQLELEPDEIAEDAALFGFGLGLDSIDALTLIVAIEDHFSVSVPDDSVHLLRSVNSVADFISAGDDAADGAVAP